MYYNTCTVLSFIVENGISKDPYYDVIMDDDLAMNQWPKAMDKIKTLPKPSVCAQVMNREMFDKYKHYATAYGWTIARAINTTAKNPDSIVGCHAGDLESYHMFKDFFKPVVALYHDGYDMDSMCHVTDMDPAKITKDVNQAAKSRIVSTRIRVARNLNNFPLNPVGTKETRLQIAALMEKVFSKLEGDLSGNFYRHSEMTQAQTQQLIDDHFLFRGKDRMQAASGYHEYWPHGRGVFVSHDKQFVCWINEGDHIRIISMEKGCQVKSVLSRLLRAAKAIEDNIRAIKGPGPVFLSDPALGMISCCPSNLGSGLRGSVHIRLPNLIKSIGFEKLDEMARSMNCQARGSSGEHSDVVDRIDISNIRRLGFPEYVLVQDMIACVNKLVELEERST